MDARIAATIILTLIFVSLIPLPSSSGSTQSQAFTIVNWCWGSTDTPEKAYPGSTRATYIVQARSELPYNVSSIIGTLLLPQGFESSDGKNYTKSIGADADGDGVIDGTDRNALNPDRDGDGLLDGSDPSPDNPDSDRDGVLSLIHI